jgi:hypothetical protein
MGHLIHLHHKTSTFLPTPYYLFRNVFNLNVVYLSVVSHIIIIIVIIITSLLLFNQIHYLFTSLWPILFWE